MRSVRRRTEDETRGHASTITITRAEAEVAMETGETTMMTVAEVASSPECTGADTPPTEAASAATGDRIRGLASKHICSQK
jgi:hypothetical protein